MPRIGDWKVGAVIQRDPELGCIPTGMEWMIRVRGIKGIPLDNFQEKYNLQRRGIAENSFQTISEAVKLDFPNINIKYQIFPDGKDKAIFTNQLLEKGIPCILALTLTPRGGWHITPVIEYESGILHLLNRVNQDGAPEICEITEKELIRRHNEWPGGNDLAWLEEGENS